MQVPSWYEILHLYVYNQYVQVWGNGFTHLSQHCVNLMVLAAKCSSPIPPFFFLSLSSQACGLCPKDLFFLHSFALYHTHSYKVESYVEKSMPL